MKQQRSEPSSPTADRYRACVGRCLDNLLAYGTDRYGPVQTPMFMSIIDVQTNEAPREVLLLDADARCDSRPGRRNPGGCDLWDDQPLLQALYRWTALTGQPRHARAADDYIRAFFERAVKPNGLLAWGSHLFYNAYTDQIDNDGQSVHEILSHCAEWETMWRINPGGVRREIEGIWAWHILNKATGQHNRHDAAPDFEFAASADSDFISCGDFAYSGGSFAHAFTFLYGQTGDRVWLDRAKLVADWHWSHRDPQTNLAPDTPSSGGCTALYCFTSLTGPHAAALLRCFEITREPFFRDVALAYIKAWLKYAWDEQTGLFWAALKLDGTPLPERPKTEMNFSAYSAAVAARAAAGGDKCAEAPAYPWLPTGYADTWPSSTYHFDMPLAAAQACVYAYELTGDRELLDGARRWARHIRASLPPTIGRRWRKEIYVAMPEAERKGGAYADGYGRAISFFVNLHRATGDREDMETASHLADEAIEKLSENGWLKGHAGKPYYETTDGVGILLCALLELAEP